MSIRLHYQTTTESEGHWASLYSPEFLRESHLRPLMRSSKIVFGTIPQHAQATEILDLTIKYGGTLSVKGKPPTFERNMHGLARSRS